TRLGGFPGAPTMVANGTLKELLSALEGSHGSNDTKADAKAKESGFTSSNSDQGFVSGQAPTNRGDGTTQAVSNSREQTGTLSGSSSPGSPSPGSSSVSASTTVPGSSFGSGGGSLSPGTGGSGGGTLPPVTPGPVGGGVTPPVVTPPVVTPPVVTPPV